MKNTQRNALRRFGLVALAAVAMSSLPALAASTSESPTQSTTTQSTTTTTTQQSANVTAKLINQNPDSYLGQQVAISGKVERVIGPGAFIIGDRGSAQDISHRILVLVPSAQGSTAAQGNMQQGGTAAPSFKDGEQLKVQGKVERLTLGSETETIQPKAERETIREAVMTMPVLIVQPAAIHKSVS